MKLTKYTHSCVVLQEANELLIIDPGIWSKDLPQTQNVKAIVITHSHSDHFDAEQVQAILQNNPEAQVFTTVEVAASLPDSNTTVVQAGQTIAAGAFTLEFYGDMHAPLHALLPPAPHNIGVLVNDAFYYGGDTLIQPRGKSIVMLAVPASAPWLRMSEAMDFIMALQPKACIPTHNAILSPQGQQIADGWLSAACTQVGANYVVLQPGQSIDV